MPDINPTNESVYLQAAALPYRIDETGQIDVLLITSSSGKKWIIPKGLIEGGMSPIESAAEEALEEAGVRGSFYTEKIGVYKHKKWGGVCIIDVFVMRVEEIHEDWMEAFWRTRKWIALQDVSSYVKRPDLLEIILSLPKFLNPKQQERS